MIKTNRPSDYHAPLNTQSFYHIYNRTNNKEKLFIDNNDRMLFLKQLDKFLSPYIDIFCYCLMSNHFHLLIRVKKIEGISTVIENIEVKERTDAQKAFLNKELFSRTTEEIVGIQFKKLFISYSMRFNTRYKRNGNLFTRRFKRILIKDFAHLLNLVGYIHANPTLHKIMSDFRQYKWSSYLSLISDKPTKLLRDEVMNWFDGRDAFLKAHDLENKFENDLENYLKEE